MTTKTLLTNGAKILSVKSLYYTPEVTLPGQSSPLTSMYAFLSKIDPWIDDIPDVPAQDVKSLKNTLNNIFFVKKINTSDTSPVIERINWENGIIYDYYQDNVYMHEKDNNGFLIYKYYVKNVYDQVFKCLWNNNGSPSTKEPYFEPGTYGINNIFQSTDGYKWKYIYTIDTYSKVKFMDTNWIPVILNSTYTPNPLLSDIGFGGIEVVNVITGGSHYDPNNYTINVSIIGDGTGATAEAVVVSNVITDIVVTNPGSNYNYANMSISSSSGSGAVTISPVSPIGGHGQDPITELGCSNIMITSQINGSESNYIPTDISYHQTGILIDPVDKSNPLLPANNTVYKTSTDLVVSPGFGNYITGEKIFQGASYDTSYFNASILSFDSVNNIIRTINTYGTPQTDFPVVGLSTGSTRTLLSYVTPDFITQSGYIAYIQNRSNIQRSPDGMEQFKIIFSYN